jgi:hypothetical protein
VREHFLEAKLGHDPDPYPKFSTENTAVHQGRWSRRGSSGAAQRRGNHGTTIDTRCW